MSRVLRSRGEEIGPDVIAACRRGDRDAMRVLYDAYKEKVYSIAFYFFHGDAAAAADVTQQVFLKLIGGLANYRGDAAFSTWLYRLVMNACIDGARQRRHRTRDAGESELAAIADPGAPVDDRMAREEEARSVRAAVAALPPKLRFAILLRYFDDLSYSEMAAALECSVGTVSSRLSRAHRVLGRRLGALSGAAPREPIAR
jgi:RNA polymerase sigma-70 factor (ECF subfamily)